MLVTSARQRYERLVVKKQNVYRIVLVMHNKIIWIETFSSAWRQKGEVVSTLNEAPYHEHVRLA
jgi:hypothetical protein